MKKTLIIFIIVLLIGMAIFYGYMHLNSSTVANKTLQKTEAFFISGNVMIKKGGTQNWVNANRDVSVGDGDIISTKAKSAAEIQFGKESKNILAAKSSTTLELENISYEGDKSVKLKKGKLLALIEQLDDDSTFEVKTPTAVCGVVGTGFETDVQADATTLKVYEGKVYLKNTGFSGMIRKESIASTGDIVIIEGSSPPKKIGTLDETDIESWQAWKGDLVEHRFRTFYIFYDEESTKNHYSPSGWLGDYDAIRRFSSEDNPHSGNNCLRFRYTGRTPQGAGWVGVYWLNPVNNWGDVKGGFNLKGAKKLSFWARGEKGGERVVRFGMGGVGGLYPDSAKAEIGPITLTNRWQKYEVNLIDKNLEYISGGFYWMTDKNSNPDGAVFYIDDILYE